MISFSEYFYDIFLENVSTDQEYFSAIKTRDNNLLRELVDQKAKESGYNIGPVYHGTSTKFNVFDIDAARRDEGDYGRGFYFTNNKNTASIFGDTSYHTKDNNKGTLEVLLKMVNPLIGEWRDVIRIKDKKFPIQGRVFSEYIQTIGYDAVIVSDDSFPNTKEYVIFNNKNVKFYTLITRDDSDNIIPLSKRFDSSLDDMRY